jgi:hypothetical protein
VGGASIALRDKESSIQAARRRRCCSTAHPRNDLAGATLVSDAVDLALAPLSDVAIDLFVPGDLASARRLSRRTRRVADELRLETGTHVAKPAMDAVAAARRVVPDCRWR